LTQGNSSDESGWAWFIPLHTGVTSVGVVRNKEIYTHRARSQSDKSARGTPPGNGASEARESALPLRTQRYLETLDFAPGLKELLGEGKLVDRFGTDDSDPNLIHIASDYSYSADRYAGDGWRVIGDAGGRIWEILALFFH
jgi:hypothetical protein